MRLKEGSDGSFSLEDDNGGEINEIDYSRGYRLGTINPVMPRRGKSWADALKDGEDLVSACGLRALDDVTVRSRSGDPPTCAVTPRRLGE